MSLALFQRNAKNIKEHLLQKDEDVSEIEVIFTSIKMLSSTFGQLKLTFHVFLFRKYLIEYLVKVKDILLSILLSLRERHSQPVK